MAPAPQRERERSRSAASTFDTVDDASLVTSLTSHPDRALTEVYRRHGAAVMALARRLLLDRAMAEEVTQEVFLRIWERPERFDENRGSLRSLLLADCHGRSVDKIRSQSSRRTRETNELLKERRASTDEGDMTIDLCAAEATATIDAVLAGLCDVEREAIRLAYYGDNSYREVALLLEAPEGTVKSRIRRGLAQLRSELSGTDVSPFSVAEVIELRHTGTDR